MHKLNLSPHASPCPFPPFAVQELGTLTELEHPSVPEVYLRRAVEILRACDLALPEPYQLNLIVQSALAAQNLYFTASIGHPNTTSLYRVFQTFVLDCVTCTEELEIS